MSGSECNAGGELVIDGDPAGNDHTEVKNSSRTLVQEQGTASVRSRKRKVEPLSERRLKMPGT